MASIMMRLILGFLCHFLLSVLPDAAPETLTGLKDDSITFPCRERHEDLHLILTHGSKKVYSDGRVHTPFKGRVYKNSGSCDLILRDLKTIDAGRYDLNIYDNNNDFIRSYYFFVHVKVNLKGWEDKQLVFDDMLREAVSVVHITKAGQEEVWRREKSALTDRLIDRNGRLTIVNFTSSDEGTYIVLNSSGEILVTYIVTESRTRSKDTPDDETLYTEPVNDWVKIILVVLVLVVLVTAIMIVKYCRRNRNNEQNVIPLQPQDGGQEPV